MSVKAAKAAKSESSVAVEPTYLELAEQRKAGNDQNSAKQGKTSKQERLDVEDLSDLAASDETEQPTQETFSEDGEPTTLEEARALLKKERDKAAAGQSMVGMQSKEVGELRHELAELKARVETQPEKKPKQSFKERILGHPKLEKWTPESKELFADLIQEGIDGAKAELEERFAKPLQQQVGGIEAKQQRAELGRQVAALREEVGNEFVTKNSTAIAQVYADHEGRLTLEQAAKVVDAEGYTTAKQRKRNAGAKDRLLTEDGLSRGSGGNNLPATKKTKPAGKQSMREIAAQVMEELGEDG